MASSRPTIRSRNEFVYLILSHGNTQQVCRLLKTIRLGSPRSAIFLHHDAKSPLPDERQLKETGCLLVFPRISVTWGDFSLVEAVLGSIEYVLERVDFSWLVVLSGQDYPLRSLSLQEDDLRGSKYDAFVRSAPISKGSYAFRYYLQYWPLPRIPFEHRLPWHARRLLQCIQDSLNNMTPLLRIQSGPRGTRARLGHGLFKKPFSDDFVCQKGSQWFTLSRRAADYLIHFGHEHPAVLNYYRRTLIPDESYFQTVLCNAKNLKICGDHRRFILWDETRLAHPITLTSEHLELMLSSGKDFGRKFDCNVDAGVLDALDRVVLAPQNP